MPEQIELIAPIDIQAAVGEDGEKRIPTFSIVAYTGKPMRLNGWRLPVVIDLAGLDVRQNTPILKDHSIERVIGHATSVDRSQDTLTVQGVVSGTGEYAREVVENAKAGFPWQASIGVSPQDVETVAKDKTVSVNGYEFYGPIYVVRAGRLGEVSFVAMGADGDTSAEIAASEKGGHEMPDEKNMEQEESQEVNASADAGTKGLKDVEAKNETIVKMDLDPGVAIQALREENVRANAIFDLGREHNAKEIAAKAVSEGWSVEKAELHMLKASAVREDQESGVFTVGSSQAGGDGGLKSIEAAVCMSTGKVSDETLTKTYDSQTLEAADKMRNIGIRDLARMCAQIDGVSIGSGTDHISTVKAAFSGTSLSGILGSSAKKVMLNAYQSIPSAAKVVAKKLSASDFKTHTGYRMTSELEMKEVGATGEIKHGTLGEDSYSYSVDTYGRMIGLTRQDVINDDLGAFMAVAEHIGRGAAYALEKTFWTLVLANTDDFFGTGNSNYDASSGTSLDSESLSEAVAKMMNQTDSNGLPINVQPKYLLVPPALKSVADELYKSTTIVAGGGSSKNRQPTANIHSGAYEPVVSPYLSNSAITGYSATAWYLLSDPSMLSAFGIAYLRGNETPTIEEVDPSPEFLGRMWRGYFDFGVCQVDYRGGVKYAGTAAS